MVFPIAGGTQDTSYEISNSLMFEDGDTAYLQRTAGANTGEDNATLSFWFKLGNIKSDNNGGTIMTEGGTSGNHIVQIYAHKIYIGSGAFGIMFPNLIRDPSAWYHLFIAFDTSQSTDTNRVKAYLNGVLLTDATGFTDYPDQNENLGLCVNGNTTRIGGRGNSGPAENFDGYLAEFHFLDGTTKAYTDFGQFDDNAVWIPKQYTGGSYGDNGFYLEFKQTGTGQNASGIGADTSGEGHHFSVNNLIDRDVAVDTPTNNFAVLNSAANLQNGTVSQGNTKLVTHGGTSNNSLTPGTIGVQNGKWYVEVYFDSTNYPATGIMPDDTITDVEEGTGSNNSVYLGKSGSLSRFLRYDGQKSSSNSNSTYMAAVNGGDKVVQIALNMDDGEITFGANGQWANGSGSTNQTFSNATAAFTDINSSGDYTDKFAMFIFADENYGTSDTLLTNFGGCPPYAITGTVYSDGNGYGKFKYEVPSGYYAVCTKNLAEYG